jgi:hypothetical protein
VPRALLGVAWVVVLLALVVVGRDRLVLCVAAIAVASLLTTVTVLGLQRTGTLLVLAGMVTVPLTELTVIPGSTLVTFGDLFFALGFAMLFPTLLRNRADVPPMFLIGMVIVLTMSLVASAAAEHPAASINLMARLVLAVMIFPLIFLLWRPDVTLCRRLAQGYVVGVAFSTLYGFLVEGPVASVYDSSRYDGLAEHPNALALTSLLAVCLAPFITAQRPPAWAALWWGTGGICLLGMWLSGSRATLVAFVLLALLYPVIERSMKAAWLLFAAATAGLLFARDYLDPTTDTPVGRLLGGGSAAGSDDQRRTALEVGIAQFRQHPLLGNGFEHALDAHLIYLEIAVCIGIFGLLGYLLVLWTGISPILTAPRPLHRIGYPALGYAMVGVLTPLLWDRYIWCVVALSFVIASDRRASHDSEWSGTRVDTPDTVDRQPLPPPSRPVPTGARP